MAQALKQRPKKVMPKSPGRPKGSPNKVTALLKDAILQAAERAGEGSIAGYLEIQAHKSPNAFLALLGKVLPMQIEGTGKDGALTIIIKKYAP